MAVYYHPAYLTYMQRTSCEMMGWMKHKPVSRLLGEETGEDGGVGRGEHFLPHKFIKRAFKCRVNSTKQLLNAGRGHQAPRKATQLFERR